MTSGSSVLPSEFSYVSSVESVSTDEPDEAPPSCQASLLSSSPGAISSFASFDPGTSALSPSTIEPAPSSVGAPPLSTEASVAARASDPFSTIDPSLASAMHGVNAKVSKKADASPRIRKPVLRCMRFLFPTVPLALHYSETPSDPAKRFIYLVT